MSSRLAASRCSHAHQGVIPAASIRPIAARVLVLVAVPAGAYASRLALEVPQNATVAQLPDDHTVDASRRQELVVWTEGHGFHANTTQQRRELRVRSDLIKKRF